jgi:hypothetical protein
MKKEINFWKWFLIPSNILVLVAYIFFTITILMQFSQFDPILWGYILLGLIQLMGLIFGFKTWQHWRDIKKGISR